MATFDWSQYFNLAKELSIRSEEAAQRSAISRAYYAAYKTAENYCNENNITIVDRGNAHQDVWDAFLARGGRTFSAVHAKGTRLKRKRKLADYDNEVIGLSSVVTDAINAANAILTYLKPLPAAPTTAAPASGSTPPTA